MKSPQHTLGLYLHIPFCKSKCSYCDFYSLPHSEAHMDAYVDALIRHLKESASRAAGYTVDSVYFGGGTPSYLGQQRLCRLLKTVQRNYSLSPDAEITLEANPDSAADSTALKKLRKQGFNRISLGVQSTDDAILRRIGRIHSFQQVRESVDAIRSAGFQNLSLDLIYGLPEQSLSQWKVSLQQALALQPEHLSCYGLKLEEGTPLYVQQNNYSFPGDELQAQMYLYTVDYLRENGLAQYEISNFARPGYFSRHNMKYWTLQEYAGFGPGAHSDFGGVRYAYVKDLNAYIHGVISGGPLLSECEHIPPQLRDTEYLMLALRTVQGLDGEEFQRRFRIPFSALLPSLERCRSSGYAAEKAPGHWHLTPEGFLRSNAIITLLWEALAQAKEQLQQSTIKSFSSAATTNHNSQM